MLDLDFVRSQFPAFSSPVLSGHAFFENAGGSYPCRQVVDRLHRFYTDRKVQPYGPYPGAQAGGAEMDEARDAAGGDDGGGGARRCPSAPRPRPIPMCWRKPCGSGCGARTAPWW